MPYAEIHFHLLPGVDDGPRSIDESVDLALAAVSDGTQIVVATPHVSAAHITEPAGIPDLVRQLAGELKRRNIALKVSPGGELAHDMVPRLSHRDLETIAQGPPGKRWLLLEAPFSGLDDEFTAAADELRRRGFAIVVGHPERALATPETDAVIEHELDTGSVLQLTAWSFLGFYDEQVRHRAWRLLASTPRVVIASDAHGSARMPALRPAIDALTAGGARDPARLAGAIPRTLLDHGIAVSGASPRSAVGQSRSW